jgi:predicted metal-dependent hydrolase
MYPPEDVVTSIMACLKCYVNERKEHMKEKIPQEFLEYLHHLNQEEYFEAHEVLEDLWHSDRIDFYKGLIQVAVAIFHLRHGNIKGSRHMFNRARALLLPYLPVYRGIDVEQVIQYIEDCLSRIPIVEELERYEVEALGIKGIRLELMEEQDS